MAPYREYRPPAGLESMVACLWEREPAEERRQRVVPDGCVDLIWLAERELMIAGADTGPRDAEATPARRLALLADAVARAAASRIASCVAAISRLAAPGSRVADVAADVGYSSVSSTAASSPPWATGRRCSSASPASAG